MIEEQRRRLADLKQKAAAEAQSQWEALHGGSPLVLPPSCSPLMHHSILHHHPLGGLGLRASDLEHAYDTLSLESSDSLDTNLSMSGNSACSPDNGSRYHLGPPSVLGLLTQPHSSPSPRAGGWLPNPAYLLFPRDALGRGGLVGISTCTSIHHLHFTWPLLGPGRGRPAWLPGLGEGLAHFLAGTWTHRKWLWVCLAAPAEQMPGSSRRWRRCCGRPMQRSLAWWSHR